MDYIQVIDNYVNLIGGEEVGLPLPTEFLESNPNILNILVDETNKNVELGWKYENGMFIEPVPVEPPTPEPKQPDPQAVSKSTQNQIYFALWKQTGEMPELIPTDIPTSEYQDGLAILYKNWYINKDILRGTVWQACFFGEIRPEHYLDIIGSDYVPPEPVEVVSSAELKEMLLISMMAQAELYERSVI